MREKLFEMGMPVKKDHLQCIDGLKGIGIFVVAFIGHYQHFAPQEGSPFQEVFALSYAIGWSMVDLFFMLSGFGMMMGYGKSVFNKEVSFIDFFLKRLRRLYPLFILTTMIVFALELIYRHRAAENFVYSNFDIYHVLQNMLCLHYGILGTEYSLNAPAWCVPVCLLCYCIFYYMAAGSKEWHLVLYKFLLSAILGVALVASEVSLPILNNAIGRGIADFSIGALLWFAYDKREDFKSRRPGYGCLLFFADCLSRVKI